MVKTVKNHKAKWCIFIIFAICLCLALAIGNASKANAEEKGEKVKVHVDAGFAVFGIMGHPQTLNIDAIIGEKYNESLWSNPPHKWADMDNYFWTFIGYYYYDNKSNKVFINKDSLVTNEGLNLFCEWKENHPDECRYINVMGTKNGHKLFNTLGIDHSTGMQETEQVRSYGQPYDLKECKLSYIIDKRQSEDIYSFHVICTKPSGEVWIEKWYTPVPSSNNSTFKYWIVDDQIVTPGKKYEVNLFEPVLKDINAIAVYDQDILNTCVSGGEGHLKYNIFYDNKDEKWNKEQDKLDINTVLLLDVFFDPKFTYRWNSNDNSLEIWYSYLKYSDRTEHYIIKPINKDQYVFNEWTINSKKLNKDVIESVDLLSMFDSKIKDFNINSLYNVQPTPKPIDPDSTQQQEALSELAQTWDLTLPLIMSFMFCSATAGIVLAVYKRRIN